jgi:L-seryl-tRNA(Ser) seleniumtransferase
MVELASKFDLPVLDDLGSGCLIDTTQFGLAPEPMVQESVKAGASLAFFSGDKLLGGPQAGIILGKKELVDRLKRHPLARAARIDKLCLAALAATMIHYLKNEALNKIPIWRMVSMPLEVIEQRAYRWAKALENIAEVVDGVSMVGGGSLPGEGLPTKLVAISGGRGWQGSVQELALRLRQGEPAIVARIDKETLLLDPRTVLPEEDEALLQALKCALKS